MGGRSVLKCPAEYQKMNAHRLQHDGLSQEYAIMSYDGITP